MRENYLCRPKTVRPADQQVKRFHHDYLVTNVVARVSERRHNHVFHDPTYGDCRTGIKKITRSCVLQLRSTGVKSMI